LIRAGVLAASVLLVMTPAQARQDTASANSPDAFSCEPDWDQDRCESERRFEAWWQAHSGNWEYWLLSALFDVDLYFAEHVRPLPPPSEAALSQGLEERLGDRTTNLVDAVYSIALRRFQGWAFAIHQDGRVRMVRQRDESALSSDERQMLEDSFPTTFEETVDEIRVAWSFEETDLMSCEGAVAHMLKFPAQTKGAFWSERELPWAPDFVAPRSKDTMLVTADGDGVYVRARSVEDPGAPFRFKGPGFLVYDQHNSGAAYDWAKSMADILEPCLKPSDDMPPWEKLLVAEREGTWKAGD